MSQVIEWAPFSLVEGAEENALLAASDSLQKDFLVKQPGFVARELLRVGPRRFVDLLRWQSRADAEEAMKAVSQSSACQAYFSLMVMDSPDPAAAITLAESVRGYTLSP